MIATQDMKSRMCLLDDDVLNSSSITSDINNNNCLIKLSNIHNNNNKNSTESSFLGQNQRVLNLTSLTPDEENSLDMTNQLSVSSTDSSSPLSNSFSISLHAGTQSNMISSNTTKKSPNNSISGGLNKISSTNTTSVNLGHIQINLNDSNQLANCSVCGDRATGIFFIKTFNSLKIIYIIYNPKASIMGQIAVMAVKVSFAEVSEITICIRVDLKKIVWLIKTSVINVDTVD